MARTLLIGNPRVAWREWLKEHRKGRDLLVLDPSDTNTGTPGQVRLLQGGKPVYSRFYGSLDPQRSPHVLLAALAETLPLMGEDALVLLFPYRPGPVLRHLVQLIAQVLHPERILIGCGTEIDQGGFPIGPEEIDLESAFPPMVQQAQRKAHWIKLLEECEQHEVPLAKLSTEGARFGSGQRLDEAAKKHAGLQDALHAEKTGGTLYVVSDAEFGDTEVARALDITGCTRAQFANPSWFGGLLCSFARQGGEDFGIGVLQGIDWPSYTAHVLSTAVAPAPVRILRLGALRIDPKGQELGELKPWQV